MVWVTEDGGQLAAELIVHVDTHSKHVFARRGDELEVYGINYLYKKCTGVLRGGGRRLAGIVLSQDLAVR
jgi:hypothetical protein